MLFSLLQSSKHLTIFYRETVHGNIYIVVATAQILLRPGNITTKLVAVFDEILRWDSPANFLFSKTLLQYPCDLTTQLLNIAAPSPKNYGGCASYLQITTGWTSRCTTTTTLFDHI
jgi:hypothetical protein